VKPARRAWLLALAALPLAGRSASPAQPATPDDDRPRRDRVLQFPRDHGAHLGARTEWWSITGWLGTESQPVGGFQVTFFRSRTGMAAVFVAVVDQLQGLRLEGRPQPRFDLGAPGLPGKTAFDGGGAHGNTGRNGCTSTRA
jgi:hypothetical protein